MHYTNWKTWLSRRPLLWRLVPQPPSPVAWTGLGPVSALLARSISCRKPPLLVLSLPRSGSSWVGDTLGHADDAMYLREPITQSNMRLYDAQQALQSIPAEGPEQYIASFMDDAFSAVPDFHAGIVRDPSQWQLCDRRHRKVVIKEVNPLACSWFIERYQPKIIFIVRHPAAIATSYLKLNWRGSDLSIVQRSLDAVEPRLPQVQLFDKPVEDFWERQGLMQGGALLCAWRAVDNYPDSKIVQYESLCANPQQVFEYLFDFAELSWSNEVRSRIDKNTQVSQDDDAFSVSRDSQQMRDAWRKRLSGEQLTRLRHAYAAFDLPWYREESDWRLD